MNTQEPGVYRLHIQDSKPAYERLATISDTIRIVMADGTWFEITMPQPNLLMVRATNCLTVHPDSANQVGMSQTVRYATLPSFWGPLDDDEEEVDCPEGEVRFFPTADDLLHDARHTPTDHE